MGPAVRQAVAEFLAREALLLDQGRLEEWLALFDDDATYWIPGGPDADPKRQLSVVYDDRRHLEDRVWRLTNHQGPSQQPPSQTARLIGNVVVEDMGAGVLRVFSSFVVHELRRGRTTTWPGRAEHHLVPDGEGSWKITLKKIDLLHRDEAITSLAIIL